MSLPFVINPKDLDPSYKMDLDFLGLFWKGTKLCLISEECGINHIYSVIRGVKLMQICKLIM